MLPVGSRLGPYEITAPLSLEGEAYRVHDHEHRREVTLQVFRVDFGAEPERLRAFEAEIRAAAALRQSNILEIYDVGTDAHAAYIVSAPLPGETVRARIDAGAVSFADAVHWAAQIRRAFAAGRRSGVRHGHLSADHVFIDSAGRVVVAGFGLASLAPRHRRASDLRALAALIGVMLSACWRSMPVRRRVAWTAATLLVAAAIGLRVTGTGSARDQRATPVAAVPAVDTSRGPVPESPGLGAPAVDVPQPPATSPLPVPPEPITPATPPSVAVAEPRLNPAPPAMSQPSPSASETAPAATPVPPPTPPVRPLTPVAPDGRDAASLMTEASVRATEFDLAGAYELARAAAARDGSAQVAALYIRGLLDAREAFREGGPAALLAPIREAIGALEKVAQGRPGSAEIGRLTLQAAAAAAQSERDEMSLYLETAIEMESLQRVAGLPGAPLVPAAEVAGDLWLQVHRYEDARRAYTEAAERTGSTLRILSGLARAARRLNDMPAACASYRRLLDAWGGRPGLPVEIAEARAYVGGCAQ